MSTLALVIGLAVLVSGSSAQVVVEDIWSAVAYLCHGEHTPSEDSDSPSLTPLGAQQMHAQGTRFRARYLEGSDVTSDRDEFTTTGIIEGIAAMAIDNTQLSITTTGDQYTSAGALSFIQGLYPPITEAFSRNAGGLEAAMLANGSLINYPLDGYQYPDIRVLSVLDPNSIWIEGHVACARYSESQGLLSDKPVANQAYDQSLDFYRALWKKKVFLDAFPLEAANFYNAHDLFSYASYRYNHDNATHSEMTTADLAMLADLASVQQRYLNGNLEASVLTEADVTRTIAGRTLAAKVVAQFGLNMASSGSSSKLNLMFGSFEPFVAFFAISRLVDGASRDSFLPLPGPGAAMVFELFSMRGNASAYPSVDDLWVRFLYRKDSLDDTPFVEYPLFGNGNSQSRMKFADFATTMEGISVGGVAQWCRVCDTANLFCSALEGSSGNEAIPVPDGKLGRGKITSVVAGVIGALVTVAVVGLAAILAVLVGRVRFYREGRDRSSSTFGGFRGAEKMRSDADVTYAGNGAQHERTGSWQLRDARGAAEGPIAIPAEAVLSTPGRTSPRFQHRDNDDDDDISVLGHTPVAPRESI